MYVFLWRNGENYPIIITWYSSFIKSSGTYIPEQLQQKCVFYCYLVVPAKQEIQNWTMPYENMFWADMFLSLHRLIWAFAVCIYPKTGVLHGKAYLFHFSISNSTASTAPCPATAFTSSKCHNSVKNKMYSTCYVPLHFFKTSRKSLKPFSSYRKGIRIWLGSLLTMFKGW